MSRYWYRSRQVPLSYPLQVAAYRYSSDGRVSILVTVPDGSQLAAYPGDTIEMQTGGTTTIWTVDSSGHLVMQGSKAPSGKSSKSPNPISGPSPNPWSSPWSPQTWSPSPFPQPLKESPKRSRQSQFRDINTPLLGYRGWNVGTRYLLSVAASGYVWHGGVHTADCRYHITSGFGRRTWPHPEQSAPAEGCTCGLWMRETLWEMGANKEALWEMGANKEGNARGAGAYHGYHSADWQIYSDVLGLVQAWGRTIWHERGIRCQHMRILALLENRLNGHRGARERDIGRRLDVPVLPDPDALLEFAEKWKTPPPPYQA